MKSFEATSAGGASYGALDFESEPADLVCVGSYAGRREAAEHGLVVLAMGLPYWLDESPAGHAILVPAIELEAVRRELALYDAANALAEARRRAVRDAHGAGSAVTARRARGLWLTPLLWAVAVVWVFAWQHAVGETALTYGALDASQVLRAQEWWRPFTALFLHADVRHVLGNLALGTFVFAQVLARRGVGRGWAELALAAYLGNVLAALVHLSSGVGSIGASTAVFAGIGLLTGHRLREQWRAPQWSRWRSVLVPLGAGIALLGLLGAGGAQVDVVAHVAGFAVGMIVGVIGWRQRAA